MTASGERITSCEEAKRLGDEAKNNLVIFYVASGVKPEIAKEFTSIMVGEDLAGLTENPLLQARNDPDLGELQAEFISLVQDGFEPSACAILLATKPFRLAYWDGRPVNSYFTTRIGEAIGKRYQELIGGGEDPIAVARGLVLKTQEYQDGLRRLFEGGLTPEESTVIKARTTGYEKQLGLRQGK